MYIDQSSTHRSPTQQRVLHRSCKFNRKLSIYIYNMYVCIHIYVPKNGLRLQVTEDANKIGSLLYIALKSMASKVAIFDPGAVASQ